MAKPLQYQEVINSVVQTLGASGVAAAAYEFAPQMVACSAGMVALLERARLFARSDFSVLITGATGTGKELLAKAIQAGRCSERQAPD